MNGFCIRFIKCYHELSTCGWVCSLYTVCVRVWVHVSSCNACNVHTTWIPLYVSSCNACNVNTTWILLYVSSCNACNVQWEVYTTWIYFCVQLQWCFYLHLVPILIADIDVQPGPLFNVLCISYLAYIPTEVPASEPKSNTLVSELCHRCSAIPVSMLNDLAIQKYKAA